ncbi:hypothetical protein ICL16_22790 [Iningainema sp. BLCCT55]|uniref:Uncharacterized protein n=1 Tax=Iningainema tapete BLCC-T55 TaxID=2748662 RepID=A0A8J6XQR8_9CYAN|nr:hypothetical protein [Iningainema tapete]MBD2774817.1 hypothetical protein [Iningainema tapete BLCC-T55]
MPTLENLWHKYLRRFALEHWYRFAKQRLHWTQPQLGSTQATERWSDLMPLLTWQLWLARLAVSLDDEILVYTGIIRNKLECIIVPI